MTPTAIACSARRPLSQPRLRAHPNAVALAELLLRNDPRWTRDKIDEAIDLGKNRSITLKRPLPVHIVYDTAWVDESGAVEFRKDVYGRDGELQVASTK